jgi:hypothetical protein
MDTLVSSSGLILKWLAVVLEEMGHYTFHGETMSDDIIKRIHNILNRSDTIPQALKDELILLGLAEIMEGLSINGKRLDALEKYKPYLQVLAAAVSVIGLTLLGLLITGKLQITILP